MIIQKYKPSVLRYKTTNDQDVDAKEINFSKRGCQPLEAAEVCQLYHNNAKISLEKYGD